MSDSGIDAGSQVRPHPRAAFRELEGDEGGVLLQLDSGGYHGLNPIGCVIWSVLGEEPTVARLIDAVRMRVTGAPDALADEILHFLEDLRERELIEISPPGT